jgi:hypothetical protein
VVRWQIASNQPFDEVEDRYFIDMMSYARRSIADKLLKADAMKNRVIEYSKESRIRLKNVLHVNAALLIFFWEFRTDTHCPIRVLHQEYLSLVMRGHPRIASHFSPQLVHG